MSPNLAELLTTADVGRGEEVLALYQDLLARECHDVQAPSPIEEFFAWEVTKTLWRLKRAGTDARAVQELVVDAPTHSSAAREIWKMTDDQARLVVAGRENIKALRSVRDALLRRPAQRRGLVALEGGRSG